MSIKGDNRDRLAALERRIRELERQAALQAVAARLGAVELISLGEVVTEIPAGTIGAPSTTGKVRRYSAYDDGEGHVVSVKNSFAATVVAGTACVIGKSEGIWILISADC